MQAITDIQQQPLTMRVGDQGCPRRQAISAKRPWYRQGAQIKQIHKVGVITELRVALHRRLGDLRVSVNRRRRGQHQYIHRLPLFGRLVLKFGQPVLRLERIHRAPAGSAIDKAAHHRVHRLRMCAHEFTHRCVALRHPRPLV